MHRFFSSLRPGFLNRRMNHHARRSASTIRVTRAAPSLPTDLDITQYLPVKKGELFGDRYEALRSLGRGAYSNVWLARDIRFATSHFHLIPSPDSNQDRTRLCTEVLGVFIDRRKEGARRDGCHAYPPRRPIPVTWQDAYLPASRFIRSYGT